MNVVDNLNSVQVINKPCMRSRCMSLLPRTTLHSDSEHVCKRKGDMTASQDVTRRTASGQSQKTSGHRQKSDPCCPTNMSQFYMREWARVLKQQRSITFYRLPTKENKLSFSHFLFAENIRKWCHFCFPFAANNWKLPFSVHSVFRIYIY